MTQIHFGPYSKTVYIENRSGCNRRNKLEINTQHYTLPEINQHPQKIRTARLVYNTGFFIDTACFQSLLPVADDWLSVSEQDIDTHFPVLNKHFHQFTLGKSMQRWHDEIPGFGPCLSFNCYHQSNTTLQSAIQDSLLGYRMNIDGQAYRLIDRGMGFYLGPKGEAKKGQRSSIESFPPSNPLSAENFKTYTKEINLDLRFALAKEYKNDDIFLDERYFYHGKHPLVSASLNIHLTPSDNHPARLMNWDEIYSSIKEHIKPFQCFITRSVSSNHLTTPDRFVNNGYWSKADKVLQRTFQPTHKQFVERVILEKTPSQAGHKIEQTHPVREEFSLSEKQSKRESASIEKESPGHILTSKNIFSVLSTDSDDESETESDQDKASNLTL